MRWRQVPSRIVVAKASCGERENSSCITTTPTVTRNVVEQVKWIWTIISVGAIDLILCVRCSVRWELHVVHVHPSTWLPHKQP